MSVYRKKNLILVFDTAVYDFNYLVLGNTWYLGTWYSL